MGGIIVSVVTIIGVVAAISWFVRKGSQGPQVITSSGNAASSFIAALFGKGSGG
ncbi:MAG TPA: hypothetical protein VMW47_11190 [Verrucomicrobiae bacterium]|nr:hypothetical protein [Verrucomicrobiae bacterium]